MIISLEQAYVEMALVGQLAILFNHNNSIRKIGMIVDANGVILETKLNLYYATKLLIMSNDDSIEIIENPIYYFVVLNGPKFKIK